MFLINLLCSISCVNNITLERFDLGNGRAVKVVTGSPDSLLPIYYEMYSGDNLIQKCFVLQESTAYADVKKLRFEILSDKSNNVFVLMKKAPETSALAIFDYTDGFRYPCCTDDRGIACKNRYNQLADLLERDNKELKLTRAEIP